VVALIVSVVDVDAGTVLGSTVDGYDGSETIDPESISVKVSCFANGLNDAPI